MVIYGGIKNQTLPAKKTKEKRMLAFVNEKTRSCFSGISGVGGIRINVFMMILYLTIASILG